MTARKSSRAAGDTYQWPNYPDDPTLGGAITVEMHDDLQASDGIADPPPEG